MLGVQSTEYPSTSLRASRVQSKSIVIMFSLFSVLCLSSEALAEEDSLFSNSGIAQEAKEGIIVNGDVVEYSTDQKEITASGNVVVTYKGAKLTCEKLTVNTQTKEAVAEGNPRLDDERGVLKGKKIQYNFETKTGNIFDSDFRSLPFFGKAAQVEKVSDTEFIAKGGYISTCNYDKPHYRLKTKSARFFPKDKIETKSNTLYVGKLPLAFIPFYNHSFKDPFMHVQVQPGKRREWGQYILTAWRYSLNENAKGRIFLDFRQRLGIASGFGLNYKSPSVGAGDLKFYYTEEKPDEVPAGAPEEFQRYLVRWRHRWVIDERTDFTSEYYRIGDEKRKHFGPAQSFLKDYFYREFERDTEPLSYALLHHNFKYSSLDALVQKRTNHWFNQLEKLPSLTHTLPTLRLGSSPLYFEHTASLENLNKKAQTLPVTADEESVSRLDTTNKFSLPMKVAFLYFNPFLAQRFTLYDKDQQDSSAKRTIFYTGAEMSAKFYRIFEVNKKFLGMEINNLRHIITPTIAYAYNHTPTISSLRLKQIDDVDAIDVSNVLSLGLSNKLQTKREGRSVNLADIRVSTDYTFYKREPLIGSKSKNSFGDFLIDLELLPYSWMRFLADARYSSEGDYFSEVNYDIWFSLGKERSFALGQRYLRGGGNAITSGFHWRLSPKWKFSTFHRYQLRQTSNINKGLEEQEYTISRDMHCWILELTYNIKQNEGHTIWLNFRLKAFPEMEFGFNQSYHEPRPGSDSSQ